MNNNQTITVTKRVIEHNTFDRYLEYKITEISNREFHHAEVDTVHLISSVNGFKAYCNLMDKYINLLDELNVTTIDVVITFKEPISLTDYKKLINLGVNVTAFEYRAFHNNDLIRTIFGSPQYLGEQLTTEEQYQIAYNIATK